MSGHVSHDMPIDVYLEDPALSSTGARRLLDSPARFRWEQAHRRTSAAFDLGHAVHSLVLGSGPQIACIPESVLSSSGSTNTNAAREFIAAKVSEGVVPLKADLFDVAMATADAVMSHPRARHIFEDAAGEAEVSVFATDPLTGVACKARFDWLTEDMGVDLKTTAGTAGAPGFGRDVAKYGYAIQDQWYRDVLRWATGREVGFQFVVVEKAPPHLVAVHQLDDMTLMQARAMGAKARAIYSDCAQANTWPGYGDEVLTPQIPTWWFDDDEIEVPS